MPRPARPIPAVRTWHRRFQQWVRSGAFEKVLKVLAKDLEERGKIDLTEAFIDTHELS
jgi:hypothetical protein